MQKRNKDIQKKISELQQSRHVSRKRLVRGANVVVGGAAAITLISSGCGSGVATSTAVSTSLPPTTTTTASTTATISLPLTTTTTQPNATTTPPAVTDTVTASLPPDTGTTTTLPTASADKMEYLYTTEHVWVKVEAGNRVRIGSTPYPYRKLLEELQEVDLPLAVGEKITRDTVFGTLITQKLSTLLPSPVSGVIVETNADVIFQDIDIVNNDPYGQGWFIVIEMSNPEELSSLLSAGEYFKRYPEIEVP